MSKAHNEVQFVGSQDQPKQRSYALKLEAPFTEKMFGDENAKPILKGLLGGLLFSGSSSKFEIGRIV
jgi:hypothetical protein